MDSIGKILIINGSMPFRQAHVRIYIDKMESLNVPYDIICWNRKGDDISELSSNYTVYNNPTDDAFPFWRKIFEIYKFSKFVKSKMENQRYKGVVVFTIAISIYFADFLSKHYKGRYIFDIRDYSPMCALFYCRKKVQQLINNSAYTSISSRGFLEWLPQSNKYIVSHNTYREKLALNYIPNPFRDGVKKILTIGSHRDISPNIELIKSLNNCEDFFLRYVGDGTAVPSIMKYCQTHLVKNIEFTGYYKKEDEDGYVLDCDMINNYLPENKLSNCLITNRFYLSVIFRKPMLVNEGSFQAEMARKYNLGLIVKRGIDPKKQIEAYIDSFNLNEYHKGCLAFLKDVSVDYKHYDDALQLFMVN